MYNDNYGVYFDSLGLPSGGKVRANDLDTDLAGQALIGMGTTHFQNNWVGSGGPVVFTGGNGIVGGGNQFNTLTGSVWFNGVVGATFPNELFTNFSNPIQLGVYGGAATTNAVFGGNVYYGCGSFVTARAGRRRPPISPSPGNWLQFQRVYTAASGSNINIIGTSTSSTNVEPPIPGNSGAPTAPSAEAVRVGRLRQQRQRLRERRAWAIQQRDGGIFVRQGRGCGRRWSLWRGLLRQRRAHHRRDRDFRRRLGHGLHPRSLR